MKNTYIINIGRQLGSGGKEIGEKLAQQLDISFYDKELINLASKESGFCKEFFEKADEQKSQSFMGGLFGSRISLYNESSLPYANYLSNDALFKIQSDVIRDLAEKESCLFVGRCADYILRDHPNCVNVFIAAPLEERIKRLCAQDQQLKEEQAKEQIRRADKRRSEYYNYYSNKTWGMAETYHLCIDSSVLEIEGTVEYIKEFVKKKVE